ncbi:MAG TPA: hypothetical protein VMU06_07535 [Stellaceae bacterium]|nr:hypothetical protein [Stellaceae bacterium]
MPNGKCAVCRHPERNRLEFLCARGGSLRAIAQKFGVKYEGLRRHNLKHVSDQYKKSVVLGPFKSEDELRRLLAENSSSVVENLMALYGGLTSRWLVNFEAGCDEALVPLSREMLRVLDMRAKISRELAPASSTVISNIFVHPAFADLQSTLLRVLAEHPEARAAVIREFRDLEAKSPPMIEVAAEPEQDRAA